MQTIRHTTAISVRPPDTATGTIGWYDTETVVTKENLNDINGEIVEVIVNPLGGDAALDASLKNQLFTAIRFMIDNASSAANIYADAAAQAVAIPSGTRISCYNNAAPLGWNLVTGMAGRTVRLVDVPGQSGLFGGNVAHNIADGCTVVGAHTHITPDISVLTGLENQAHNHTTQDVMDVQSASAMPINGTTVIARGSTGVGGDGVDFDNNALLVRTVTSSNNQQNHNHWLTVPATATGVNGGAATWQPTYVNSIVIEKI